MNIFKFLIFRKFQLEQFKNTQEIVKKILKENENIEKKKKLYPNLFNINLKPINKDTLVINFFIWYKIHLSFNYNFNQNVIEFEREKTDLTKLGKIASTLGYSEENVKSNINVYFPYLFMKFIYFKLNFLLKIPPEESEDPYEHRSIMDSTTIASKDEEDSDYDELSKRNKINKNLILLNQFFIL